jgi:AcrR family transcriptional regulator
MGCEIGLRQRKKERTRRALEDAALDLFTTKGFADTTVEDIAAAADVSPRTFFRYFATKEDVLFGEDAENRSALTEQLASRPRAEPPLEKLRAAILAMANEFGRDRDRLIRVARVKASPNLRAKFLEHQYAHEQLVSEALLATDPGADPAHVRLVVATAFAALRATLESWLAAGGTDDLVVLATQALDQLGRGLDLPPTGRERP